MTHKFRLRLDMTTRLKSLYWQIESAMYELFARLMRVTTAQQTTNYDSPVIVSLTSYKPRFRKLYLTIKCLLRQSIKPNKIILWVSYDDYRFLPENVKEMSKKNHYFEIYTCEDIKSYKKIIPSLKKFPNAHIVTADDDVFYPKNWLLYLLKELNSERTVITHRAHEPIFVNDLLMPYDSWNHNIEKQKTKIIFPTGVGGILYSRNSLPQETLNQEEFMNLAQSADDLWLFWMASKNNVTYKLTKKRMNIVPWINSHKGGLAEKNVDGKINDEVINNLQVKYGSVKN